MFQLVGCDDPARRRDMRYCPLEQADEDIGPYAEIEMPQITGGPDALIGPPPANANSKFLIPH